MATPVIVAVNFTDERLQMLKLLAMLGKAKVRPVGEEEKNTSLGEILGFAAEDIEEIATMKQTTEQTKVHETMEQDDFLEPITKEAIIFCGFEQPKVNMLLEALKRGRLKNIPLKAMLTPNNITWKIETILQELSKEHEFFHGKSKK